MGTDADSVQVRLAGLQARLIDALADRDEAVLKRLVHSGFVAYDLRGGAARVPRFGPGGAAEVPPPIRFFEIMAGRLESAFEGDLSTIVVGCEGSQAVAWSVGFAENAVRTAWQRIDGDWIAVHLTVVHRNAIRHQIEQQLQTERGCLV